MDFSPSFDVAKSRIYIHMCWLLCAEIDLCAYDIRYSAAGIISVFV